MNCNYTKAYKEVIEILKHISDTDKKKIPSEIYQALENNMDNDYEFNYDINKSFDEQELLQETKAILIIFYRDYWATPEIKAKILAKQTNELIRSEQEKKIKYNSEQLLKKEIEICKSEMEEYNSECDEYEIKEEKVEIKNEMKNPKYEMIIYQEEKWYEKFLEYIKNIFSKKRDN